MSMKDEIYHPHWMDQHGVVHIGNFTGPFTACGKNHMGWSWRDKNATPATCMTCIDYFSRRSP